MLVGQLTYPTDFSVPSPAVLNSDEVVFLANSINQQAQAHEHGLGTSILWGDLRKTLWAKSRGL